MKVCAISSIPVNLNFKAIKTGINSRFTPEQENVAESIIKELRTPKDELGNMTAEDYYKNNHDLDFLILPRHIHSDSVELFGTCWQNSSNFNIGTYNTQNTKESDNSILMDIQKAYEKTSDKSKNTLIWCYLALAAFLYGSVFVIGRAKRTVPEHKALIENADTLLKKSDTITSDTANFLKYAKP